MKTIQARLNTRPSNEGRPHPPSPDTALEDDPFGGLRDDSREPFTPTRSKLLIPYYPKDVGDRSGPFPAGVTSWWCQEGLRIFGPDGAPHLGPLDRAVAYTVIVSVANAGHASAWAEVALYWSDPTVGFGPPHLRRAPELSAVCCVRVAPGAIDDESARFRLTPSATTPNHICLLAAVNAFDDAASGSWDPLSDRHYAQRNLDVLGVKQGGLGSFWFFATNPLNEAASVTLSVEPAAEDQLRMLAHAFGAEGRELRSRAVGLMAGDEGVRRPAPELELWLAPRQRRLCQGVIATDAMRRGELAAVSVEMTASPARADRGARQGRGSFGVIVLVE